MFTKTIYLIKNTVRKAILWKIISLKKNFLSLQYHMIFQKSFWYANMVLKKDLLLSMLRTVVLFLMNRNLKRQHLF